MQSQSAQAPSSQADPAGWDEQFLKAIGRIGAEFDLTPAEWEFLENFAVDFYAQFEELLLWELHERIRGLTEAAMSGHPELATLDNAHLVAKDLWLPPTMGGSLLFSLLGEGVRLVGESLEDEAE